VARSITGARTQDHVKIEDLLAQAGLKSANRMVVKAIAAETWSCFHSDEGKDSARNHVGRILFSDKRTGRAKTTRTAKTGQIEVPLRGGDTFVTHAAHVWNRSATLRQATLKAKAKKAASDLQVSPRYSSAGRDSPPAARGVFPAGCGAYPRGLGTSPSRSWAHPLCGLPLPSTSRHHHCQRQGVHARVERPRPRHGDHAPVRATTPFMATGTSAVKLSAI
jgi:hypothetical protein